MRRCIACVTSPPYWGLRSYDLGTWEGGDPDLRTHNRKVKATRRQSNIAASTASGRNNRCIWRRCIVNQWPNGVCGHCGAIQQDTGIGLEPTLGEWLDNIVSVGREIWRVLRDDGTWWLNLGDAYAGSRTGDGIKASFQARQSKDYPRISA